MKRDEMASCYPIFLNISGRKCVVIGGGSVSLRKVKTLLEHRAQVEVVSPELAPELEALAEQGRVVIHQRDYRTGDLDGAFLAIAATDDGETNRRVAEDAKSGALMVNVVDDPENSDFILPSCINRGDVTIAISTAGRSPALARKIRTRLEEDFGEEYGALALLIDEVRSEARRQGVRVDSDAWQEALDLELLLELIRTEKKEEAKTMLFENLKRRQK